MKPRTLLALRNIHILLFPLVLLFGLLSIRPINAQNQELQQRVAEIKQTAANDKQAMAQYTWVEQVTISLKGEQKKREHFQVRLGPDGKPLKTSLDPPPDTSSDDGGRKHRLKEHVVEKKKEEYKEYADQLKALAQLYLPPDKELLQQAYEKGNITLGPAAGVPNEVQLIIKDYLEPQDSLTLVFDKVQKELLRIQIASYMNDPKDAMNLTVQFSRLPDRTNHISNLVIDGVGKQLNVAIQNSNYQHLLEDPAQQTGSTGYSGQGAQLSADELQQLVAPIALYPDALVAQILGAATFPDQVAYADNWLQQNQNLTGKTLMQAVDAQSWDSSVKGLTQFPSVLDNLAKNLSWTSALGESYHTQTAEVMSAIQVLRAKAQAAGNLKSGPQITVVQQAPQTIVIQSANPQVVYVPVYNTAVVYGSPYATPGYSAATVAATGVIAFGAGVAVGAMMSGGCCGWGYSSWNCGWHGTAVVYHGGAYYGNSAWHGGYYGSSASAYGPNGAAHYGAGYNPSTGTYARGATASNAYGSQSVGQAYNPRTGAYGATEQGANANGSWGSSTVSKNGQTAYTQHQTTAQGSVGSVQTSSGGKAVAATGQYNSAAAGETANGNKYATANGNAYKNTGSGWQKQTNGSWNNVQKPSSSSNSSAASKGWEQPQKSSGSSSALSSGGGGWQSRSASARGSRSLGGGGGWGGRSSGRR